jgi:hypothetical protein
MDLNRLRTSNRQSVLSRMVPTDFPNTLSPAEGTRWVEAHLLGLLLTPLVEVHENRGLTLRWTESSEQILGALVAFQWGGFPLTDAKFFKDFTGTEGPMSFEGFYFSQLPAQLRNRFRNNYISWVTIECGTDPDVAVAILKLWGHSPGNFPLSNGVL